MKSWKRNLVVFCVALCLAIGAINVFSTPALAFPFSDGYYIFENAGTEKAIEPMINSPGSYIGIYNYTGMTEQTWLFIDAGNDYYMIKNEQTGLYLTSPVSAWYDDVITQDILFSGSAEARQLWKFYTVSSGVYNIQAKNREGTNLYMAVVVQTAWAIVAAQRNLGLAGSGAMWHVDQSIFEPSILVLYDQSYEDENYGPFAPWFAGYAMDDISLAFMSRWGIIFSRSYLTSADYDLPFDMPCPSGGFDDYCTTLSCGANSSCATLHHKSFNRNISWMKSNLSDQLKVNNGYYNMILLLTHSASCFRYSNGTHRPTISGGSLAYVPGVADKILGNYAISNGFVSWKIDFDSGKLTSESGKTDLKRSAQHELSHLYGCADNQCTPGSDCIMTYNAPILSSDDFSITDLWCDTCQAIN